MKKPLLTVLTALAAAAALPAAALADNTLTIVQGDAVFRSEDAGVANKFVVEDATGANAGKVRFYEPADPFGINYPPACNPGETHQGPNNSVATVEVFCPKNLVNRSITIETGPSEDSARYSVADVAGILAGDTGTDVLVADRNTNDFLSGDQGNDDIDAGGGNDEVRGEEGNDVLKAGDGNDKVFAGSGADTVDAGAGDDTLQTNDGTADKVNCGPGTDSILADTVDDLTDCENADRQFVAPPADQPAADDKTRPKLQAGGSTSQRITRRRGVIRVAATSSEKGLIQATAFLAAGGINSKLKPLSAKVTVAGGGAELKLELTKRLLRLAWRDLLKHRHPRVRVTVSCVDEAGNTSAAKHFWIALRR